MSFIINTMKQIIWYIFIVIMTLPWVFAADVFDIQMESDRGEYIWQGKFWNFNTTKQDIIKVSKIYDRTDDYWFVFEVTSFSLWTPLRFSFESKDWNLQVGEFYPAKRFPFNDPYNGIDISWDGRWCNSILWGFHVLEIEYTNGKITKAAIDFLQYCEEIENKWLYWSLRYNSDIPSNCNNNSCSSIKSTIEWWVVWNENTQNKDTSDEEIATFISTEYENLITNIRPKKFPLMAEVCTDLLGQQLWIEWSSTTFLNHYACWFKYTKLIKMIDDMFTSANTNNQEPIETTSKKELEDIILLYEQVQQKILNVQARLQREWKYTEKMEILLGTISVTFDMLTLRLKAYIQTM